MEVEVGFELNGGGKFLSLGTGGDVLTYRLWLLVDESRLRKAATLDIDVEIKKAV